MSVSIVPALTAVLLGFASAAAAEPPIDVYVLSGQSNMWGLARLSNVHPSNRKPPRDCYVWDGVDFVALAPVTAAGPIGTLFGPELSFCHAMAQLQPDRKRFLIKYAAPGRGLHHGWLERKWLPGPPGPDRANFYPGESAMDPNMGRHYAELRAEFEAALSTLTTSRIAYEIRGVLWMQGETDAINVVSAEAYASGLALFKQRLQQDLESGELPLVFGQVLPRPPESNFYSFREQVRDSQARAHWNSGKPAAIPGAWMVATDGMPVEKQGLHYTAEGQIRLGYAMAVAMVQMQSVLADARKASDNSKKSVIKLPALPTNGASLLARPTSSRQPSDTRSSAVHRE
jgi:hypothetical protein